MSEIIDCDQPLNISSVNNLLTDHKANTESISQVIQSGNKHVCMTQMEIY